MEPNNQPPEYNPPPHAKSEWGGLIDTAAAELFRTCFWLILCAVSGFTLLVTVAGDLETVCRMGAICGALCLLFVGYRAILGRGT